MHDECSFFFQETYPGKSLIKDKYLFNFFYKIKWQRVSNF